MGAVLPATSAGVTPAAGLDANDFVMGKLYCTSSAAQTATVAHRPLEAEGIGLSSSTIFTLPSSAARNADSDNWCVQFWIARYQLRAFFRYKDGPVNGWGPWKEFSTATPPQEYALPLAAGVTGTAKYCKDQFGYIHFRMNLTGTAVDVPFGTLPVGYRPDRGISKIVAQSKGSTDIGIARLDVSATGTLVIKSSSNPGTLSSWVYADFSFRAS